MAPLTEEPTTTIHGAAMSYDAIELENVAHDERRTTLRRALRLHATIGIPSGRKLGGRTIDLSCGGVCVVLPFELTVGDECSVSFDVSACGEATEIRVAGRVCYCMRGADGFRIGLQFIRMNASDAAFIESSLK